MTFVGRKQTRRSFLLASAGGLLCKPLLGSATQGISPDGTLRTIAYNVLECIGFPEPEKGRPADSLRSVPAMVREFARALAPYAADIITFSEAPAEPVARQIAGALGMTCLYFPSAGKWPGTLMTRLRVLQSRNCPVKSGERPPDLFTRHWYTALLEHPEIGEIALHGLHLRPFLDDVRNREVTEVLAVVKGDLRKGRSVLLQGDLNHTPEKPEYRRWVDAGLKDTFAAKGFGDGLTVLSNHLERRIDYIFAGGPLAARIQRSQALTNGKFVLPNDGPGRFALSDHVPQFAVFS